MNELRNRVQLIGYLGTDPEFKKFENGNGLTSFRMATNENYKNKDGNWVTDTQWHNVVAWSPLAERLEKRLNKGSEVAVVGKLVHRNYESDKGGKRYVTEVVMSGFESFDKSEKSSQETKEKES